jgi:hypothetical protein
MSVRNLIASLFALSLVLSAGSPAGAQSPVPADDAGTATAGISREEAVSLVLASDPRFGGLRDYEDLEKEQAAQFSFAPLLTSGYHRVLGPITSALAEYGVVSFRHPTGWLIETTLVEACTKPSADADYPLPDPCAWRHTWYHLVASDGSVTLLADEGDPEPMPEPDE